MTYSLHDCVAFNSLKIPNHHRPTVFHRVIKKTEKNLFSREQALLVKQEHKL